MEPLLTGDTNILTVGALLPLILVVILLVLLSALRFKQKISRLQLLSGALALVLVGGAVVVFGPVATANRTVDAVQSQKVWVEDHGVSIEYKELGALKFPEELPTEDATYGTSLVAQDDSTTVELTLAWENGEFVLYDSEGQRLQRSTGAKSERSKGTATQPAAPRTEPSVDSADNSGPTAVPGEAPMDPESSVTP